MSWFDSKNIDEARKFIEYALDENKKRDEKPRVCLHIGDRYLFELRSEDEVKMVGVFIKHLKEMGE